MSQQANPAMPLTPSPHSPASERSSPFLPSIDESSSEFVFRKNNEKKLMNPYNLRSESGSSLTSQVPSLAASSDESDESMLEYSIHSTDSSGSDSSVDYEYENDDDNEISCSIRSTQSMPPTLSALSARKGTNSARRRADSLKRSSKRSFQLKSLQYGRSSSATYPESSSNRRMSIPPPPFAKQSRRRSYPPITQSYPTTTKSGVAPSTDLYSKSRRLYLGSFLFSGVCGQLLLLLGIAILVVWSRSQAAFASDTLLRLKETESMGLLKLHRLESHSMQVHELMRNRILRESGRSKDTDDLEDLFDGEDPEGVSDPEDDPLLNQHQQLAKMALDLHKHADITKLQSTIQETAIDEIVSTYGEGPVKVVVELDFDDKVTSSRTNKNYNQGRGISAMAKGTYISIILWPDTPHAAWTWLEQIQRSIWDGSFVRLNPTSTLLQFGPTKADPKDRGHLEFVEGHNFQEKSNPDMHHGAWTIGMREAISDDHSKSHLEMFINLADNREERKHETCIGKIFDGFDALQRLLEGVEVTQDGDTNTNVSVKSVSAMHMTHHELQQIYR